MNPRNEPKLALGDPPGRLQQPTAADAVKWLRLLTLLNVGVLACVAALFARDAFWSPRPAGPVTVPAELKATALALEDRGLEAPAADAWQRYLEAAPEDPDRAEILFRVGRLYQQAERFDQAATAFVRAEMAAGENKDLAEKIGPQMVECLRGMGRYGEVGRELSRRVSAGGAKPAAGEVVAAIGDQEITETDLDRMIEHRVDQMLASQGTLGDKNRRQAVLQQLSNPTVRAQLLHELVQNELFIRRAHELKLDAQEDFLLARQQAVDNILIRRLLNQELDLPTPTDTDLEAFYRTHQAQFRQPESVDLLGIRVADEKAAAAILEKIKSADDFRKRAEEIHQSGSTAGAATFARKLFRGQADPLLGNTDALFDMPVGQWTKQSLVEGEHRFLVLVEKKAEARTPSFAEMKQYVQGEYARQKQQEAVDKLFDQLKNRYQVQVMLSAPERLPGLSTQSDRMLGETGPGMLKPQTPPAKPPTKPDNPLRDPGAAQKSPLRKEKTPADKPAAGTSPAPAPAGANSDKKEKTP